jgi:integrase
MVADNPAAKLSTIKVRDEDYKVDPYTEREYRQILKAIQECEGITSLNRQRIHCLAQLQRWSGLSIIDGVCLSRDELKKNRNSYWIDTTRRKTGVHVRNPIPSSLGQQLEALDNNNREYFFMSGEATAKSAAGLYDKLYRKVFEQAGIKNGGSHRLRHLFAVSLLGNGADMRTVSRALGHSSIGVTEKYYASWDRKQQENLDKMLRKGWARKSRARD